MLTSRRSKTKIEGLDKIKEQSNDDNVSERLSMHNRPSSNNSVALPSVKGLIDYKRSKTLSQNSRSNTNSNKSMKNNISDKSVSFRRVSFKETETDPNKPSSSNSSKKNSNNSNKLSVPR